MLTFKEVIDFARLHKEDILRRITDIANWIENDDLDICVAVRLTKDASNNTTYLTLLVDCEYDVVGEYPSVNLFSVYVDEEVREYSHEKLLALIDGELQACEELIDAQLT